MEPGNRIGYTGAIFGLYLLICKYTPGANKHRGYIRVFIIRRPSPEAERNYRLGNMAMLLSRIPCM